MADRASLGAANTVLQVVDREGSFQDGVTQYLEAQRLASAGVDYQLVAITGPQSSGKSTLMNVVFGTKFEEMDAYSGRNQTTKGIWLARATRVSSPLTLVMDLEGSDGRERGEDDSSFERQSSLFALALADILLVNMWSKDVGREAGASKPLLKTIFQVNLKLFLPAPNKRRTVLLFVFRDRTRTPLAKLRETWLEDLAQIWAVIPKPPHYEEYTLQDFFEVHFASLPNYEDREEEFLAESVLLRRRFTADGDDSLVASSEGKLPGQALGVSMQNIWEVIRSQKDLNLPAHKVMVANIRCGELAAGQLRALEEDQAWRDLLARAQAGPVPDFGACAAALLDSCYLGYDEEARYFEEGVRRAKRNELVAGAQAALQPVFHAQLRALAAAAAAAASTDLKACHSSPDGFAKAARRVCDASRSGFKSAAETAQVPGCPWPVEPALQEYKQSLRQILEAEVQGKVKSALQDGRTAALQEVAGPSAALCEEPGRSLWPRLQRLLEAGAATGQRVLSDHLAGYGMDDAALQQLQRAVHATAQERIEQSVREAAGTALPRLKECFATTFSKDAKTGLPRAWGVRTDIAAAAAEARAAAAELLAQLAVLRFGQPEGAEAYQAVDEGISNLATPSSNTPAGSSDGAVADASGARALDLLAATQWPGLPARVVLLSPPQCRALWRQFTADSMYQVQQAQATQDAHRAASNRWPPVWALLAIALLGFNEAVTILTNPFYLLCIALILIFGSMVYKDLDVDASLQRGLLPGLLSISSRIGPAVRKAAEDTAAAARELAQDPQKRRAALESAAARAKEALGVPEASQQGTEGAVAAESGADPDTKKAQ